MNARCAVGRLGQGHLQISRSEPDKTLVLLLGCPSGAHELTDDSKQKIVAAKILSFDFELLIGVCCSNLVMMS